MAARELEKQTNKNPRKQKTKQNTCEFIAIVLIILRNMKFAFKKSWALSAMPNSRKLLLHPNLIVVNNKKTLVVLLLQKLLTKCQIC